MTQQNKISHLIEQPKTFLSLKYSKDVVSVKAIFVHIVQSRLKKYSPSRFSNLNFCLTKLPEAASSNRRRRYSNNELAKKKFYVKERHLNKLKRPLHLTFTKKQYNIFQRF